MTNVVAYLFQLEDQQQFEPAFELYSELYFGDLSAYQSWKYFYFFLWTALQEAPSAFHEQIRLHELLLAVFQAGKRTFFALADFNFIAGYTACITPYAYGEYTDLEQEAQALLLKACELEPDNLIFRLAYLGSGPILDQAEYEQAGRDAAPHVLEVFRGNGFLNTYFRLVLYRP